MMTHDNNSLSFLLTATFMLMLKLCRLNKIQ